MLFFPARSAAELIYSISSVGKGLERLARIRLMVFDKSSFSLSFSSSSFVPMSDLLTTIKDGFETMEASQEVAFRAFYNAQKRQRANGSPSKFGSPQRGE